MDNQRMAGYIAKETIDAVHNTSDMISIIGEYTKLERRSGNDWWGCCPFHGEKTASFHVVPDKGMYYCFGCHASGDIIKFVMETEKISYVDAIHSLAKKAGIQVRYQDGARPENIQRDKTLDEMIDLYDRTASLFHYFLMETPQGKEPLEYITKRGITRDTLEKFKIGYSPADRTWLKKFLKSKNFSDEFLAKSGLFSKNYPDISFFSDRLMFPVFNRKGQAVAFGGRILHQKSPSDPKYLNSGDLIQFKKRETMYAFDIAKKSISQLKKVIICEGYMDCIAYHQCGIDYAVATLGTALTEQHVKMLSGFVDTVLLSFDSDGAGQKATMKGIEMCRKAGLTVRIIRLQGGKDPAEIMMNFGKENLTNQVNASILDCDYLLNKLGEMFPVETPEGKTKAALEFFPYVDWLQSDIQKESSLEQLCQTFNLRPEAVKRDFKNRNQARDRISNYQIRQKDNQSEQNPEIQQNAEIRGILAVTSNLDQFKVLREQINESDFQDSTARQIYNILEESYKENSFSIPSILDRCQDNRLVQLITDSISSGAYNQGNIEAFILDFIKFLHKSKLEAQISSLQVRINNFVPVTPEDHILQNNLISEMIRLEFQARNL